MHPQIIEISVKEGVCYYQVFAVCLSKSGKEIYQTIESLVGSGSLMEEAAVIHRVQEKVEPMVVQIGSMVPELGGDKDARNLVDQEEASFWVGCQVKEMDPVKWTDEKHSLYLKSMEASFVHQLHNSSNLLGWCSQKHSSSLSKSSSRKHTGKQNPSGQLKVFQDGRFAKINLIRGEPQLNKADESGFLLSNPWIQHYMSGFREHTKTSTSFQEKKCLANIKEECPACDLHLCHQDSVGCNTGSSDVSLEVTDQNFTDEDPNEEQESRANAKRMKISVVAVANQDQVVPLVKLSLTEDVAEHHISSEV